MQTYESPVHESIPQFFNGKVNWTFSYHTKSEIQWRTAFYVPRGKYKQGPYIFPDGEDGEKYTLQLKNAIHDVDLSKKLKPVLWMVSNCSPRKRRDYTRELQRKGLTIDIFGGCGKPDPCKNNQSCLINMYTKYYFYLAFENSQCEDYITEKSWRALTWGMVPVVLGPSIQNYKRRLPPDSFIHIDNFTGPVQVVDHIHYLLKNKDAYYKYHAWRNKYDIINFEQFLWACDVCKKINDAPNEAPKNISDWWTRNIQCQV